MISNSNSISFIVPCYNEEKDIDNTLKEIYSAINESQIEKYEIIIVDDGSIDNTYNKIINLNKENKNIKIIRNSKNLGLGGAIKKGISKAILYRVMFLPGDNCHKSSEIKKLISVKGDYDLVLTYYSNPEIRNFFRVMFTKSYTPFLNLIYGLNLPYYNGISIYKRSILNEINIYTNSFTWQIEALLKLFKTKNLNYTIVPTRLDDRMEGQSKAFNLKNSIYVIYSITRLFILQFLLKKRN